MTRLDSAVDARLSEIRDMARSGVTERTGKSSRFQTEYGEERGRRIGGMMAAYPEIERLGDSPKVVAAAIDRGKGKVYRRVRYAVASEMEKYFPRSRKRSPEKPTVPAHARLTKKCKTCGVMHGKGGHRFHGKGSFHQTHLFAFNPPVKIRYCSTADTEHKKSVRQFAHTGHYANTICLARSFKQLPANFRKGILAHEMGHLHYGKKRHTEKDADKVFGVTRRNYGPAKRLEYKNPRSVGLTKIYGNVTRIFLASGHYDLRRSPRMFGLPGGEIWITWGNPANYPRDPDNALVSRRYGRVKEIQAQKTHKHRCDAGCKEMQHKYYHPFEEPNMLYQLRDGSLLVVSR